MWSPNSLSPHTNMVSCPPCAFLNVGTHVCWPGYDFRYIVSFKLKMIPDDLVMINDKPRPRSRDVEERNKTPLEFLLATNGKWSHPLAFWVKANTGQIVKKIVAPPASN